MPAETVPGLAFAIVATDGAVLRTIHPAALGPVAAGEIERVLRAYLFGEPAQQPAPPRPPASATATLTQREIAAAQGFTGDACNSCGAFSMKRAGTCLTCQACGGTTGCG